MGLDTELVKTLGAGNVLDNPGELAAYQIDDKLPSLIVFTSQTEDICQVARAANREGIPLIPWGNGSKQAMGLPLASTGIVLSLKHILPFFKEYYLIIFFFYFLNLFFSMKSFSCKQ